VVEPNLQQLGKSIVIKSCFVVLGGKFPVSVVQRTLGTTFQPQFDAVGVVHMVTLANANATFGLAILSLALDTRLGVRIATNGADVDLWRRKEM